MVSQAIQVYVNSALEAGRKKDQNYKLKGFTCLVQTKVIGKKFYPHLLDSRGAEATHGRASCRSHSKLGLEE